MTIGTSVALPVELSCTSPRARGPLSFFWVAFFCWGGISGSSSCAALKAVNERSKSAMTPAAQPRYKIFLPAARMKTGRRALLLLDLDVEGRNFDKVILSSTRPDTLQLVTG